MSDRCQSDNSDSGLSESSASSPQQNLLQSVFQRAMSQHPNLDFSFYREYCRLFLSNIQLMKQIKQTQETNRQLEQRLLSGSRLSNNNSQSNPEDSTEDKKKRMRRTAGEIARHYVCRYEKCQKSYGSEGSLNQHIKLKHGGTPANW